jgi:hypothetical protein
VVTAVRRLSNEESEAIIAIAGTIESDSERDLLLADIRSCTVTSTVADGSMLMFNLEGYVRPEKWRQQQYKSRDGFRAEGVVKDKDGVDMDVMLFQDQNHRLLKLDIVRYQGGPVIAPDWSTFRLR